MNGTRWLAVAASSLAVALGGGAALAATGSSNPASDFLGDVANRLGISQDKLEGAIQDATIARIDAAVAAGDITKAEGDALKERVRSGGVPPILPGLDGPPIERGSFGMNSPVGPVGTDLLAAAAGYLGMDEADVREALRDGKSLADVADEKGKSVDGLVQALRDEIRRDADQAVEDGALPRELADRVVEKFSACVDELVQEPGGPGLEPGPPMPLPNALVPGFVPSTDLMKTAADYLEMTEADLRDASAHGKSLADLADDKGKPVAGLKQALRDAIRGDANKAVEEGALTNEQADRIVEKLGSAVDELVESDLARGFGFGFRNGPDSFSFRFKIAPGGAAPRSNDKGSSYVPPPNVPLQPA